MANLMPLDEAIADYVHDGDSVALEGFTHLIPHASGHEIIRQGKTELHLIKTTPDIVCDQLIGSGCAAGLTFSWAGNPGVGSLHRLRDAVESSWPNPLVIEEHTHDGMVARYAAGASGLPHAIAPGYLGTDLASHTSNVAMIECPFTARTVPVVSALRPDVALIHAQRSDRHGNVQIWGILGVQKEAVLSARRAVVTVEEVVDELEAVPGQAIIHHWTVDAVCEVPRGAHPSYADGYNVRDNDFYLRWDEISRDRGRFEDWIDAHVRGTRNHAQLLNLLVGAEGR